MTQTPSPSLDIGAAFRAGWRGFTANIGPLIGSTLISYVIASLVFSVMLFVGLVLLIIPGLIVAVVFGVYGWALVDKGLDPIGSLRESSRLTAGRRGQLFVFLLAAIGLNILGLLALVVGVLITSAVTLIAAGHVYRQLDGSLQPIG